MLFFGLLAICLSGTLALNSEFHNSNCANGREVIVHLFEWKWTDIAAECERFLGPMGFCGVQVSPPNEHAMITTDAWRPWWERYQPVSYKLTSRSGTDEEFIDMVERCNNVDVRIYIDAIINHMTGMGREGYGTAGSYYNADDGDFPGVPYTMEDFHDCSHCDGCCCVDRWTDWDIVRKCRLEGLIDLDQTIPYVAEKTVEYLNSVIDIGVAGFRIDAGKHMHEDHLRDMFLQTNTLNSQWFPSGSRAFIYIEVLDLSQHDEIRADWYKIAGKVTEFRYCQKMRDAVGNLPNIEGVYDPGWGMLDWEDAFVFVDNHDNQRGHGAGGDILTFREPRDYKLAQAITMGYPYGYPRIMSSYDFEDGADSQGPPSDDDGNTNDVIINPDGSCGGGWICEHRWPAIAGMVSFAKATSGQEYHNKWTGGNSIAFSRGDRGFMAMTNDGIDATMQTGLPSGEYCNVVTGCATDSGCAGQSVTVNGDGTAHISLPNSDDPILAIHVEARAGSGGCIDGSAGPPPGSTPAPGTTTPTTPGTTTTRPPGGDIQRTVVFLFAETQPGQDLFFRGGIGHDQRPGCSDDATTSACAISIDHNELGSGSHYEKHNAWRVGDNYLDWYGAESGQGSWNGEAAEGTPTAWTSNDQSSPGYQPLNQWGDHYWMVDFDMACSETEDEWFELKAVVTNMGWEGDISQDATCTGSAGGTWPYSSNNHMARCGFINVFSFNSNSCIIDNF